MIPSPIDRLAQKRHLRVSIMFCLICIASGLYEFQNAAHLEEEGWHGSFNMVLKAIYDIGGRYAVLCVFLLMATVFAVWATTTWLRLREESKGKDEV